MGMDRDGNYFFIMVSRDLSRVNVLSSYGKNSEATFTEMDSSGNPQYLNLTWTAYKSCNFGPITML